MRYDNFVRYFWYGSSSELCEKKQVSVCHWNLMFQTKRMSQELFKRGKFICIWLTYIVSSHHFQVAYVFSWFANNPETLRGGCHVHVYLTIKVDIPVLPMVSFQHFGKAFRLHLVRVVHGSPNNLRCSRCSRVQLVCGATERMYP